MVTEFSHEQVRVVTGRRSGLPVIVAVHSTALGQAIGGCRLARYPGWRDGLADALRLSAAMTDKCAVAGLPHGGGKTVIALPPDLRLDQDLRVAALHDAGDAIASLDGAYATGPDVGTGPADMATLAERTPHVFCRPTTSGGSGDSSPATATGTLTALRTLTTTIPPLTGNPDPHDDLVGRRFSVIGLGHVGALVARGLAAEGAELVVTDVDGDKRALADELGATWVTPDEALRAEVDVLVPAALGGLLTPETVPLLRCLAIAGPANNQLDDPATADLLHDRGIVWAPDFVVSAGGIIHATAIELLGETPDQALTRVTGIGDTLATLLATATATGTTPLAAARSLAQQRIAATTTASPAA
jgi:glutamate dehydrogenase/leucine dehydrogenase